MVISSLWNSVVSLVPRTGREGVPEIGTVVVSAGGTESVAGAGVPGTVAGLRPSGREGVTETMLIITAEGTMIFTGRPLGQSLVVTLPGGVEVGGMAPLEGRPPMG